MRLATFFHTPPPVHAFAVAADALVYGRLARRRDAIERVDVQPVDGPWFHLGPVGLLQVDRAALSAALAALLQRLDTPPKRASLVIPDSWVRSVVVDVGSLPRQRQEAEEVVRWRLKKILPCRPEDVRFDYLGGGDNGRTLVMMALDRPLAAIEDTFAGAGIRLGRVEPIAMTLSAMLPEPGGRTLLVVVDGRSVALVVRVDGRLQMVRHKLLAEEAAVAAEYLGHELSRTLAHVRERDGVSGAIDLWIAADDDEAAEIATRWASVQGEVVAHRFSVETAHADATAAVGRVRLASLFGISQGGAL